MKAFVYFAAFLTLANAGGRRYIPQQGDSINHHGHALGGSPLRSSLGVGHLSAAGITSSSHGYGGKKYGSGHSQGLIASPSFGQIVSSHGSGLNTGHNLGSSHDQISFNVPQSAVVSNVDSSYGNSGVSYGRGSSAGYSRGLFGSSTSGHLGSSYGSGWNADFSSAPFGINTVPSSGHGVSLNSGHSIVPHGPSLSFPIESGWHAGKSSLSQGVFGSPPIRGWSAGNKGLLKGPVRVSSHAKRFGIGNTQISHGIRGPLYAQSYGSGSFSSLPKTSVIRPTKVLSSGLFGGNSDYGYDQRTANIALAPNFGSFKHKQGVESSLSGYQYPASIGESSFHDASSFGNTLSAGLNQRGRYASGSIGGAWDSSLSIGGSQSGWGNTGSW